MYAVIKTGGKQYRVAHNDVLKVEKLDAEVGKTVTLSDVMMIGGTKVAVGAPFVAGASVEATVLDQARGEKVYAFKRRRRKHSSKRLKGHRQSITVLRVTDIVAADGKRASESAPAEKKTVDNGVATQALATEPENLLITPKGERDDFTVLSGVNEEAQEVLYDVGAFHFWQLAAWNESEIAFVQARLAQRGVEIEGTAWLEDAKAKA